MAGLLGFVAVAFAIHFLPVLLRRRRLLVVAGITWSYEAVLLLVAQALTVVALYEVWWSVPHTQERHVVTQIPFRYSPPFQLWLLVCASYWSAYGILRWLRYRGSRLLLPVVCMLSGIGFAMVFRLEPELGTRQACWIAAGLMVYSATGILLRDYRLLYRFRWAFLVSAVALQVGLVFCGVERNGARLWYSIGKYMFQPVEVVKILLLLFLASCLNLDEENPRVRRRTLGIFAICWASAELLLAGQRDLGMALLLFGLFLAVFYVATGRTRWVAFIVLLAVVGSCFSYYRFGHVRVRVQAWSQPWEHVQDDAYQLTQGLFSVAAGHWVGEGWGGGQPDFVPEVATDFIFVAIVEETGSLGGLAVICIYILLTLVAFEAASRCRDSYARLLIVGLATLEAWQTIIVLFGILRVAPMTGLALPFIAYGGSSMVSNFFALGILQRLTQPDSCPPSESEQAGPRETFLRNLVVGMLTFAALQVLNLNFREGGFLRTHPANPRLHPQAPAHYR